MSEFKQVLAELRNSTRITQDELSARTGIPVDTLRAYEQGKRRPSEANLARLGEALKLRDDDRTRLYSAAGRSAPSSSLYRLFERGRPEHTTIPHQLAGQGWVSLVTNELHEIVGWNGLANAAAELDLGAALPNHWDRNLLWMASLPHFQDRLTNWDELIGRLLWFLRQEGLEFEQSGSIPAQFAPGLNRLLREAPDVLARVWKLWMDLPPLVSGSRNVHPITWRLSDGVELAFWGFFRDWSLYDGVFGFDWMAANEQTSAWVEGQIATAGYSAWAPIGSPVLAEDFPELLEASRRSNGLSRRALAGQAGVSEGTIYAYERGLTRPSRETLLRLSRVMTVDATTRNRMLGALGYPPEPSRHARWMVGDPGWAPLHAKRPMGLSPDELYAELDSYPWPCFLLNSQCHVERVNDPANALTGLRRWAPPADQPAPHLLQVMLSPLFRERALNWSQLVTSILPDTLRLQIPDLPDPKLPGTFQREVSLLRRSDPAALRALLDAWESAPPRSVPMRVATPLEWLDDNGDILEFHCFVTRWNARDSYWAIDWHPANAAAWQAVARGNTASHT